MADSDVTTRRGVLKLLPMASAALVLPVAAAAPTVPHAAFIEAAHVEAKILRLALQINQLLRESAPDGALIRGFQFTCLDGAIKPGSVWATAITSDYELAHMRPDVFDGWRRSGGTA